MNPKLIIIDGKTYHSVDEMPPEVREKYERAMRPLQDANDNLIPDVFEDMNIFTIPDVLENIAGDQSEINSIKIILDGKEFDGIDHLPPEVRAKYEQALRKLDADGNGVPDFAEGIMIAKDSPSKTSTSFGTERPLRSVPLPVSPTITPDTSNGWRLVLAGLFLLSLCVIGAAGVWYYFLR